MGSDPVHDSTQGLESSRVWGLTPFLGGGIAFALLATANGAGYRYGVSDQAFYIPVVVRSLDAGLFPRDAPLIDAQGRLMTLDEVLAALVGATGMPLDLLFFLAYLLSLAVIWTALVMIGTRVYHSAWAVAALAAAVTMRHRIPRTSVNSLEPYFNPRMLAFGLGALAIAALLRRRRWAAVALVAAAAPVHLTTALWFAVLLGVAMAVLDRRFRLLAIGSGVAAAAVLVWAATTGPLRGTLVRMDATWLQAVASKDSLFATAWPAWAWAANFGFLAVLWWTHHVRSRRGSATREDAALVWGATALVGLFLVTLPFVAAGVSLVVQFQISRIFWLVEFLALVYVIAVVCDAPRSGYGARITRGAAVAAAVIALSAGRGAYIMLVERPERALFEIHLADSPWEDAMRWVERRPRDTHVLADPGHAWKYGTSVRVSAERDVLLEDVKDSAVAIYSRDVAARVVERIGAIGDFGALTPDRARELAARYDLDLLVTEADLELPLAYRNDQFRIYALK